MTDDRTCKPIGDDPQPQSESNDARFRFCLSEDGMKLGVSRYFPPSENGDQPSVELIKRQVAEAGVQLPVDEGAAKKIITNIKLGKEYTGITLVHGIEVQEPEDAKLKRIGKHDFPVFPGDRFAIKYPAKLPRQGQSINGKITKPQSNKKPSDIKVQAGENCDFDPESGYFTATVYGMPRIRDNEVRVDKLLRVDKYNITITSTVFHQNYKAKPITVAAIEKQLLDMGVAIDIRLEDIDKALRKASVSEEPQKDVVLVSGKHPVHGKDGWLELLVSTREDKGTEDDSGRIDFKNRGTFPSVEPEQVVARLHPPTKGESGIDIFGKTVPPNEGHELVIHEGENIELFEDGITFKALEQGILINERNTLSVSDCLVIPGNVDMNTGNIKLDKGSVKINGNVLAGFSVEAPKHVLVEGSIESAEVRAGGSIEVKGGILMPEGGHVEAKGDLSASYMNNAQVVVHGTLTFKNEITNSRIQVLGEIRAEKGKGIIQGGVVSVSRGMEVNELGSELGVQTTVSINMSTDDDTEAMEERKRLANELSKIDNALGDGSPQEILERMRPGKREAVIKIIKHRVNVAKRLKNVTQELVKKADIRKKELANVKIKVTKAIHPGVMIKMGGRSAVIKRPMDRSSIYWHPEDQKIAFGNL